MPEQVGRAKPPQGISRLLWRAPIWIYRLGLGGLMRERMLLLHHIGRISGQQRENVLEIVDHNEENGSFTVASGFGKKSDWYKNIINHPDVSITVGRTEIPVTAQPLPPDQSGQAMVNYAKRHPTAAKNLMSVCGYRVDGSAEDYFVMGRDHVPLVLLRPRE